MKNVKINNVKDMEEKLADLATSVEWEKLDWNVNSIQEATQGILTVTKETKEIKIKDKWVETYRKGSEWVEWPAIPFTKIQGND